jgi:flagellar basal-body rod modification protein FlgD
MFLDATAAASRATASAGGRAAADETKLAGDLNRFLTLLVTQLQNQDPLEPLDANQFTTQLVQFASVEQQINQNANLEKLLAAQTAGGMAAAIGYLGTTVEGEGAMLPLQDGTAEASYTMPGNAAEATAVVRDAAGKAVFTTAVETAAGRHAFRWDGRTDDGRSIADGAFSLQITAKARDGSAIQPKQTWTGRVTGIGSDAQGTLLSIGSGGGTVRPGDLLSIEETRAFPPGDAG